MEKSEKLFTSKKDQIVTPLALLSTFTLAGLTNWGLHLFMPMNWLQHVAVYYINLVSWTLVILKVLRTMVPIKSGIYPYQVNSNIAYAFNLHAFLSITNLSWLFINGLVPPLLRKFFYRAMGAKIGSGIIPIGGRLLDPFLTEIEKDAFVGEDSLLIAHAIGKMPGNTLILGKIHIKRGALIGARSVIMPGVTVGEGSMVNAMSFVPMNTKIPAGEIWGGNPAVKISDMPGKKATVADNNQNPKANSLAGEH